MMAVGYGLDFDQEREADFRAYEGIDARRRLPTRILLSSLAPVSDLVFEVGYWNEPLRFVETRS